MPVLHRSALVSTFLTALALTGAAAQQPGATAADYARAEKFLAPAVTPLVSGTAVRGTWFAGDRYWYRNTTPAGTEFLLADPVTKKRAPLFDQAKVATALTLVAGGNYDGTHLPFTTLEMANDGKSFVINLAGKRYSCDVRGISCVAVAGIAPVPAAGGRGAGPRGALAGLAVLSPDGKRSAFIRDWNLWVRDVASNQESQLTTDGMKDFGYATDNAGWANSDRAILLWSPDSRKIATYQQDQRNVGDMYLVSTTAGHPTLRAWKYPLPGDSVVTMLQRVVVDVDAKQVVRFQMAPDQHRSTNGDNISMGDVQWSPDASQVAFVSVTRDHKTATLRVADAANGSVRTVLSESVPKSHFESGMGKINWQMLWPSKEVLWWSQRDNWGQLYLYDATTGALKNQITTGEGNVATVVKVDEKARTIWFTGVGREAGRDPYFRHLYRVGMDGKGYTLLTPDNGDHDVQLSPSGAMLVDTWSRPDAPQVTSFRSGVTGKEIASLEKADISRLVATGWKPPMPITMKGRDGTTDIYGLMFRPSNFDSTRKYPIINQIYPGPQTGSVGGRAFTPARGDAQALAELGFIVVEIDGMGTPNRSKSFHEAYYANMGDNTLPDQITGMKQLAAKYPWIDLTRVGIWGHSGGGFATADAMFRYPDFFKVGIAESGNHDNRVYEDDWGERYQGLLAKNADGTGNYDDQANQNLAKNLKGHLLLAHGTMDNNVPPYNTLLVVDALIKANKDFDLLLLPNQPHGYGAMSSYMMRRRWDYFVRWLQGVEPPKEFQFAPPTPGGPGGN
ncbi:MAG: DPP IV N-terminal domain-containing protein [Gemmatimonadales bacterium]